MEWINHLTGLVQEACEIDKELFTRYQVKRGLRNEDHTGVLVGLTNIGDVQGYIREGDKITPAEGKLFYRGIDVYDLVHGFAEIKECLKMTQMMLEHIKVNEHILDDPRYDYLFSVEEVNRLVLEGMPFRDAYKQVGKSIADGTYQHPENIHHTHEGSIGNLCNEEIRKKMDNILESFHFEVIDKAYQCLLQEASM